MNKSGLNPDYIRVISEVSQFTGTDFLNQLSVRLASLIQAQYVYIVTLDSALENARVVAGFENGQQAKSMEYSLENTPCQELASQGRCAFNLNVQQCFPEDHHLAEMSVNSYIGTVLTNTLGQKIGLMSALYEEEIPNPDWAHSVFDLFSVRVLAEIERHLHQLALSEQLIELEKRNREIRLSSNILHRANEGILIADSEQKIRTVNPAFERLFDTLEDQVLGDHLDVSMVDLPPIIEELSAGRRGTKQVETSLIAIRENNQQRPSFYVKFYRDRTEEQRSKAQLQYRSTHDEQTGLLQRQTFLRELDVLLEVFHHENRRGIYLSFDIDNFKSINQFFGTNIADQVVKHFAHAAKDHFQAQDLICKSGADEVSLFIQDKTRAELEFEIFQFRQFIREDFSAPGFTGSITFTSGAALFPENGASASTLLSSSALAMQKAKANGRNTQVFFDQDIKRESERFQHIYKNLSQDGIDQRIYPVYQAIVCLDSREVMAFEALARWRSKDGQIVSPQEFVEVCEHTGLIRELGDKMFQEATAFLNTVRTELGLDHVCLSMNRSPAEILDRSHICEEWLNTLADNGLCAEDVQIEITENLMIKDPEHALRELKKLNQSGFSLSIDDFGTGFSSLAYINQYPFSNLKIDRSFVSDIEHDPSSLALVESIINIAKTFSLTTIAEGVETREQADILQKLGCDKAQGFYFHRPMDADSFFTYLSETPKLGS
ncbi:putative bifunctional diguanylate cyclase/phosphodiesterase [Pseudoteredinibacter isoporae]|uniref:putative bifunctional diguanylate cyclase/phosphodiesterase n=1 Tax=Pseudoteredinibacter isoporae TaxID=570281 RepID=UPI0031061397